MLEREEIGRMTEDEFLQLVKTAAGNQKYEFLDGLVYTWATTSEPHSTICFNLVAFFHAKLRGTRCKGHSQGRMLKVQAAKSYFVPDLFVRCGDPGSDTSEENAVLVVEVQSKSTASFDKTEKRIAYQQLPSLREYLIIHQDRQRVDRWSKNGDEWKEQRCTPADGPVPVLSLPCGRLELPFDLIYEGCEPRSRVKEEEPPYIIGN